MTMDTIRMDQDYACEYSSVDEEPKAAATRFFKLLKDSNKPL
jgi:hypothetical protein